MATPPTTLDGEVRGTAVQTIPRAIDDACGFFGDRTEELLAEYGLDDASAQAWYDVADYAAVFEDVLASTGEHTVRRIGKELAHVAHWDGDVDTVAEALATLDDAYYELHSGSVGGYEFDRTGEESGRLVCTTPYPLALEQGLLRGIAQRFSDTGFLRSTVVDESREDGLYVTTLDVEWWESTDIETGSSPSVDATAGQSFAGAD